MKMRKIIILDSTPLGLLTSPTRHQAASDCTAWLASHLSAGNRIYVPEIIDYEIRRELLRLNKQDSLDALDGIIVRTDYLAISSEMIQDAAHLWADIRRQGLPTAGDYDSDIDAILAAQARSLRSADAIVATSNVRHMGRYVPSAPWETIDP